MKPKHQHQISGLVAMRQGQQQQQQQMRAPSQPPTYSQQYNLGAGSRRDFISQRGFSGPSPYTNPVGTPQRGSSGTPVSSRDFLGTPTRDVANNNVGAGTPGPQPHTFLPSD
ncbi:hypothetical protein FRC09_015471 [Ceratobasidium sp. 395]|nr:hypothetical protein FRC09_015471 [Ceratobasidium sp. 395]